MREYARLIKRKDEALSLFTKTRDKLRDIVAEIMQEQTDCERRIADETARRAYLERERVAAQTTVDNITQVIGDKE